MSVVLGEFWAPWKGDIRRAVWRVDGTQESVLALVSREPCSLIDARRTANHAMAYRGVDVFPLLGIEPVGDKVAWLYPNEPVLSLGALPPHALSVRGIAEVMRRVIKALDGRIHPGPLPDHVLLDAAGGVRLADFVGPESVPDFGPVPRGDDVQARVYQLGLLCAHLFDAPFQPTGTESGHRTAARRLLVGAMSRPGSDLPSELTEILPAMVAWDPTERPTLARLEHAFSETSSFQGAGLLAEVRESFVSWLRVWVDGDDLDEELSSGALGPETTQEVTGVGNTTLRGGLVLGDLGVEDEPTVDSELGQPAESTPTSSVERGVLPVGVGPPAEAMRHRPMLPSGFLATEPGVESTQVAGPSTSVDNEWRPMAAGLLIVAVLLAAALIGLSFA